MSIEELMKPRYKVIADYPLSPYTIGDLVELSVTGTSFHCTTSKVYDEYREDIVDSENYSSIKELEKYPHLFKQLFWADEREEKDMPEYVKFSNSNVIWKIKMWDYNWFKNPIPEKRMMNDESFSIQYHFHKDKMLPATIKEYLQYQQSKK